MGREARWADKHNKTERDRYAGENSMYVVCVCGENEARPAAMLVL